MDTSSAVYLTGGLRAPMSSLANHFVRARQHGLRNPDAERAGRPGVHDEPVCRRHLEGQIGGLRTLQDFLQILGASRRDARRFGSVRDESARIGILLARIDRRQPQARRRVDDLLAVRNERRRRRDDQYVDPFENQPNDQGGSGGQGGESQSTTPDTGTAPAQSTAPTATDAQSGTSGDTLPRTGFPLVAAGLSGVFLLTGGFAVRRRT